MKRICFIGNSHLAAFKLGWDAVRDDYPDTIAVFYGAPSTLFADIAVENHRFVAKSDLAKRSFRLTAGNTQSAPLADYDVVVLVALDLALNTVLDVYGRYRSDDHRNSDGDFELVSSAYFNELVKSHLALMPAMMVRDAVCEATKAGRPKIWLCPQPMPCMTVLTNESADLSALKLTRVSALKGAAKWHDEDVLYSAFSFMCAEASRGDDCIFEQPAQTRISSIFTRPEYSRGSFKMSSSVAHPEDDYTHMNADYGVLAVRQIMDRFSRLPV